MSIYFFNPLFFIFHL